MAYPTVDKPYGLQPVNLIGGQVYAGSTRLMRIASGYSTSIYYGDVVKLASDGTVQKDTGTSTATPVGIFVGCTYTNPSTNQKTFALYWPASTAASDAQAYVVDDPDILFKVATVSSGTTVAFPIRIVDIVPDTSNGSNGFCEYICKFNAPYVTISVSLSGANTATVTGGHAYLNPTGV